MTIREQIQRIHTLDSLPSSYKRKLRVLRSLYLNPLQSFTQLKSALNTQRDTSVRPVVNSLLNDGYIIQKKKPIWVSQIHAWRVVIVYETLPKADNLLVDQVK